MTLKIAGALVIGALLVTGCNVKETEDAEGDTEYQIDPAPVDIGTDTQTVRVPDIDIGEDSVVTTTN